MRNYLVLIAFFLVTSIQAQIMLPAYQAIQYRDNVLPTVVTTNVTAITTSSALSGGTITSDGGTFIIAKGICWSTSPNPTIALTTKTIDGTGISTFSSSLTSLIPNITYYVRAYATNNVGTAYGNEIIFTSSCSSFSIVQDIDGNVYNTVLINNVEWMQQNLNVEHYRNGDVIPQVTDPTEWGSLTTGAWCYFQNNSAYGPEYGKLYNYYAVIDPRGLAPEGWHIPNNTEWNNMIDYLGGSSLAGDKLKEAGSLHWISNNTGNNLSCWFGFGGGARNLNGSWSGIISVGHIGFWWSVDWAYYILYPQNSTVGYGGNFPYEVQKRPGVSIRCVKN